MCILEKQTFKEVFDLKETSLEDLLFSVSCRGIAGMIASNCEKDGDGRLEITFEVMTREKRPENAT